jgi:hypothetical protein
MRNLRPLVRVVTFWSSLPGLLLLGACHNDCQDYGEYALYLRVRDARSGANIVPGATAVVQEGSYTDSVTIAPASMDETMSLALERPGTYLLRVRRPGYLERTETGIRIGQGECHVEAKQLTISLTPVS